MLEQIKSKAKEIVKQVLAVKKAEELYGEEPSIKNGIAYHNQVGKLLELTSELTALNVQFVQESGKTMRGARIADNRKALGYG